MTLLAQVQALATRVAAEFTTTRGYVDASAAAKLDTSAASVFLVPVFHGDDAAYTRPDVPNPCLWIGTVTPDNWLAGDVMGELGAAPSFVGAFDAYTAPFRAVSLRRLLASYTGPLIRVRRSSDGVEQDIASESDGDLDTTALLAFVGSSSATVATWYDQSGNARHMTQATAANQPTIVNSGTLFTVNGKAAIDFDGTTDFLSSSSVGLWAAGAAAVAMVGLLSAPGTNATVLAESGGTGASSSHIRFIRQSTANLNFQISSTVALTATGSNLFDNAQHHAFLADTGAAVSSWKDVSTAMHAAVAYTRPTIGTFTPTVFNIGAAGSSAQSNFLDGALQEVVMWASAYTADRAALSGNQRTYWGTP